MSDEFYNDIKKCRNSIIGFLLFLFLVNTNYSIAFDLYPNSQLITYHSSLITYNSSLKIHAFHTSITQIDYNPKAKSYEVSVRIFTDDFELAINTENKTKGTKIQDGDKNDALVSAYVLKHFSIISPQNKKANLKYIGKENEDLATWLYFELPEESIAKGSKIQQNVLMELFDDQVNIVNIKKGEERKSLLFDLKNKSKMFE